MSDEALCSRETSTSRYSCITRTFHKSAAFSCRPALCCFQLHGVKNSFCWYPSLTVRATMPFMVSLQTPIWYPLHAVVVPLMRAPCHHAPLTCQTAGLRHACGSGWSASARPCCPPSPCSERCHCDWALPQYYSKHHPRRHWPLARVQRRPAHPYPWPHWGGTVGWIGYKETPTDRKERIQRREREIERETDRRETDAQTYRAGEQKFISKVSHTSE